MASFGDSKAASCGSELRFGAMVLIIKRAIASLDKDRLLLLAVH